MFANQVFQESIGRMVDSVSMADGVWEAFSL